MTQRGRPGLDRAALLVIDAQDSFKVGPRWAKRANPRFEKNVSTLIDAFRAAGRPVVYVLHSDEDEHFQVTSPHYKVMNELAPRPGEPTIHKTTRNAFTSTNLQPLLLGAGVTRIVITGIQTEQCCETTARVGADLGFDVDFVTEATQTFPIQKTLGDDSEVLGVEAIVEGTEYALRRPFARIATVQDIVKELGVQQPA